MTLGYLLLIWEKLTNPRKRYGVWVTHETERELEKPKMLSQSTKESSKSNPEANVV